MIHLLALASLAAQAPAAPTVPSTPPTGYRQHATTIMSDDPARRQREQDAGFSEAIVVGDTIYVSGVIAALQPGETDLDAAFVRAFDEIGSRLARVGSNWGDVVEITSFHTDLVTQNASMIRVKQRYLSPPYPAWTAIGVSRLVAPTGLTEIRVTAVRRSH